MRLRTWILLGTLASTAPASAPSTAETAQLTVALRWADGPSPVAALTFRLKPGWHLYWTNPGDSGLPPEARWTLPQGWRAEPLAFPVPERVAGTGGVDFLLSGTLTLLARLVPPPGWRPGAQASVAVDLDWLACEAACVPGRARLAATLGDPATRLPEADLQAAHRALPIPGAEVPDLRIGPPRLTQAEGRWQVVLPLAGAAGATDFFPEVPQGFVVDHAGIRVSASEVVVPLLPSGPGARLTDLRGILRLGDRGVALAVPLPPTP